MKTNIIKHFSPLGKTCFYRLISFILLLPVVMACKKIPKQPEEQKNIANYKQRAATSAVVVGENEFYIATCNITTDQIEIYDANDINWNSSTVKWAWKPTAGLGYTSNQVNNWGNPIDIKQRRVIHPNFSGQTTYMAIAGGKLVTLVDRSNNTKKWAAVLTDYPRAIELLPNGNTVVASFSGNWIRVYASSQDPSSTTHGSISAVGVRGIVYDHLNGILWAASSNALRAYKIGGLSSPSITELTGMAVTLPNGSSGFDVSPYYGDLNKLCVSTSDGAYFFNKTTASFTPVPGASFRSSLMSLSNQPDGRLIEVKNDVPGACPIMCDDEIDFYNPNGSLAFTRTVSGGKFSKAKTISEYYQTRSELAVASYNVRVKTSGDDADGNGWTKRHEPIARNVIRKYNFDIFGVQEPFASQIADMNADLGGYTSFGVSDNNNLTSNATYHFHNIFYKTRRFELLDDGKFWLSPGLPSTPPANILTGSWGGGKAKACIWGKFRDKINNTVFYLFNTHFYGANETTKEESAVNIIPKISAIAGNNPVILMGDLNTSQAGPKSIPFNILNNSSLLEQSFAWANAAFPSVQPMKRNTYNGFNPDDPPFNPNLPDLDGNQIDHIFLSSHWQNKVKSHTVIWEKYSSGGVYRRPSDHNPVMIELEDL